MSRKHILDAIDASLRRLRTDYVDIYQLHGHDPATPLDEALEALDRIVQSGKARYSASPNWLAFRIARAIGRTEVKGLARIASAQPRYNLLFRAFERDLLPLCREEGVAVIPITRWPAGFSPASMPTRRSRPRARASPWVMRGRCIRHAIWHDREFATIEALRAVAAEAGMSLATLAVAWVLANPAITAPIIGASRPEQLADSLAAVTAAFPADLKARLDDLTIEWRAVDAER